MSDLISRSDLINKIRGIVPGTQDVDFIVKLIENQPTAYSVDKIIEELELHSFELGTDALPAHYVRLNEAIEIVKQGGVSEE